VTVKRLFYGFLGGIKPTVRTAKTFTISLGKRWTGILKASWLVSTEPLSVALSRSVTQVVLLYLVGSAAIDFSVWMMLPKPWCWFAGVLVGLQFLHLSAAIEDTDGRR